jgi:hypothetical protein
MLKSAVEVDNSSNSNRWADMEVDGDCYRHFIFHSFFSSTFFFAGSYHSIIIYTPTPFFIFCRKVLMGSWPLLCLPPIYYLRNMG